jgi:hypothetical protein
VRAIEPCGGGYWGGCFDEGELLLGKQAAWEAPMEAYGGGEGLKQWNLRQEIEHDLQPPMAGSWCHRRAAMAKHV